MGCQTRNYALHLTKSWDITTRVSSDVTKMERWAILQDTELGRIHKILWEIEAGMEKYR